MATLISDTSLITDAQINTIINQGMYEIATQAQWPWLEESATISLVDSTRTVALPSNYDYGAVLVDDDNDHGIDYMAPSLFFKITGNDTGNESATPSFWTLWDGVIYLHPIPSANDSNRLTLYYYKEVTTLAADGDSPAFHEAYHWALVEYGKWKLWDNQEYFDQAERAFITYSRYISDMMSFYATRTKGVPFVAGDGRARRKDYPNIPLLNI